MRGSVSSSILSIRSTDYEGRYEIFFKRSGTKPTHNEARVVFSERGAPPNIHDFRSYFLHLLTGSVGERTNFAAPHVFIGQFKKSRQPVSAFQLQDRFMMLRCRLLFTNSADANSAGDSSAGDNMDANNDACSNNRPFRGGEPPWWAFPGSSRRVPPIKLPSPPPVIPPKAVKAATAAILKSFI